MRFFWILLFSSTAFGNSQFCADLFAQRNSRLFNEGAQIVLVRVGVDQSYGGFNAPMDVQTGQYTFIPIPEQGKILKEYQEAAKYPSHLEQVPGEFMHMDPDFFHSTYGDTAGKAKQISKNLKPGDIIVYYTSFKDPAYADLQYAFIGLNKIDQVIEIDQVPIELQGMNAHTRRERVGDRYELVVFGSPQWSGRLSKAIPIGELRARSYRVKKDLLETWGGISTNDGFIQRSGALIFVNNAKSFIQWLEAQNVELIRSN